jgi:hypothetical protein
MARKRYSEEKIIQILKEAEAGKVGEVIHRHRISPPHLLHLEVQVSGDERV